MLSNRQRRTVAIALLLGFVLATPRVGATLVGGLLDETAAKAALKCQNQIGKAGEKFIKNKQKTLDKCITALFNCVQKKKTLNDQLICNVRTGAKCETSLDKIFDRDEPKLEAAIVKKCQVDGKLTAADVLTHAGLDFQSRDAFCQAEFGIPLVTVGDIAECIRRQKACTVERLFRLQFPRAAERLSAGGVNDINRLDCLMGSTTLGSGFGLTDAKTGKAISKCAKGTKTAGAKFVSSKVKSIEKCVNAIFKCVQTKQNDPSCIDKAATKCGKEFGAGGKIEKAERKLRKAVQKKCGGPKGPDYADLAGANGMNLNDITGVCTQYGVANLTNLSKYIECLYRQHECFVEEMIAIQYPRLEGLLTEVGFEDEVPAIFCP